MNNEPNLHEHKSNEVEVEVEDELAPVGAENSSHIKQLTG